MLPQMTLLGALLLSVPLEGFGSDEAMLKLFKILRDRGSISEAEYEQLAGMTAKEQAKEETLQQQVAHLREVQALQQQVSSLSEQKLAAASDFESKLRAVAAEPDSASEVLVAQLKSSLASEQAAKAKAQEELARQVQELRSCSSRVLPANTWRGLGSSLIRAGVATSRCSSSSWGWWPGSAISRLTLKAHSSLLRNWIRLRRSWLARW